MRNKRAFGVWMAMLAVLLSVGVGLLIYGLREYDRSVHWPRRTQTALLHCQEAQDAV